VAKFSKKEKFEKKQVWSFSGARNVEERKGKKKKTP